MMGLMSGIMATALAASIGACVGPAAVGIAARACDKASACAGLGVSRASVDADGDGACDCRGDWCGLGCVDADGDGVCDNWGGRERPLDGTGYGANGGHGPGRGRAR